MQAPQNAGDKPALLVALLHDNAARDLLDSGVLEDVSRQFRLAFVGSSRLTADVSHFGPVVRRYDIGSRRLTMYLLGAALWHMAVKRRFELNRINTLRLATFGMSPRLTSVVDVLSRLGLARPAALGLRFILRLTAPSMIPADLRPDAVAVYTSVRSHFADDVVRSARRRNVPTLGIINNWDNLNTKAFFERPDFLGLWGEQGFLIARLMHAFTPSQLFVIGAPRFEIYRRAPVSREVARARLGIDPSKRVLLFCGAGVPFEEISLLDEFDAAVSAGRLPADLVLVYKPHPLRFKRAEERPFDPGRYAHVVLAPEPAHYASLEHYPTLMGAADAIVSPFSSMVMEGAYFGLPALCLGYNDPGHANHDWNRAAFNLHNFVIRHGAHEWTVLCESRAEFLERCRALLALIGDSVAAQEARAAASMVWLAGRRTVAERLTEAIRSILGGATVAHEAPAPRPFAESMSEALALTKES